MNALWKLEQGGIRFELAADGRITYRSTWPGDVRFIRCEDLRAIPDGAPIPEDAGPPPQP